MFKVKYLGEAPTLVRSFGQKKEIAKGETQEVSENEFKNLQGSYKKLFEFTNGSETLEETTTEEVEEIVEVKSTRKSKKEKEVQEEIIEEEVEETKIQEVEELVETTETEVEKTLEETTTEEVEEDNPFND